MLAVAAVLTACTNEDNFTNEQLPNTGNEARTFTVNIPASMGEGATTRAVTFNNDATPPTATGSFAASEPVYVYNETKGVMLSGELHPTDISADGKSCNLTGELTGSFDEGDQLTLLYNMNFFNDDPVYCCFDYYVQDGSESGVIDGGMATGVSATISGITLTTAATVTFAMQQAIFRLKFTDGTNPISVKSLKCTGSDIAAYYYPFENESSRYPTGQINVNPTTATSDYLYVALCINESAEPSALTFTVTDDDGDVYTATKAAPSSGFKNGKYYYSSAATVLTWQTKLVKPTITWTSVADITEKEPDVYNEYNVYGPEIGDRVWGPSEFTISGTSRGYRFYAFNGATIHLDNLDAIKNDESDFIYSTNDQCELTLDISGTNTITCKKADQAISSEGTLKLMGNGTLTVTANTSDYYGLYAKTNYQDGNNSDASVLAAPGYAVTRSDMTDNQDGTYTWTYTVTPAINGKFSVSSTKQVYFSKGNLQATTTDLGANWTWAFAAHQWDYVGNAAANTSMKTDGTGTVTANGTVDLFGWVGASSSWTSAAKWGISASKTSDDYGNVVDEALKSDWGNVPGIGSGWYTLSQAEWNYLFNTRSASTVNGVNDARYAKAIVNGVNGIVLFPDSYTHPTGVTAPNSINSYNISFANAHNTRSGDDWTKMEKAGCVFLPAGGNRNGTLITSVGLGGYYWTSTSSEGSAYYVYYTMSTVNTSTSTDYRYSGYSVRLVRDAN